MIILKDPRTPLLVRVASIIVGTIVALLIVHLVFNFGYYASGLAAWQAERQQREQTPIPLEFAKP